MEDSNKVLDHLRKIFDLPENISYLQLEVSPDEKPRLNIDYFPNTKPQPNKQL